LQATGATLDRDVGLSQPTRLLRWHFNGQVPVIQINERGRFQGFGDPGMKAIKDHPGLYVARDAGQTACRCGISRTPSASRWRGSSAPVRGVVMDTYALEKLTGLDAGAFPAAGFAAVPLARSGWGLSGLTPPS